MTADRFDQGKPQLHYNDVFPVAQEGVARVSEYGATKYNEYNFKKGAKGSIESYNCARRHMSKWLNGVDFDEEAAAKGWQLHHIDLAIWNLKRLRQELEDFPERDNRPHIVMMKQACTELTRLTEELGGYEKELKYDAENREYKRDTCPAPESTDHDPVRVRECSGLVERGNFRPEAVEISVRATEGSAEGEVGATWARAFYSGKR